MHHHHHITVYRVLCMDMRVQCAYACEWTHFKFCAFKMKRNKNKKKLHRKRWIKETKTYFVLKHTQFGLNRNELIFYSHKYKIISIRTDSFVIMFFFLICFFNLQISMLRFFKPNGIFTDFTDDRRCRRHRADVLLRYTHTNTKFTQNQNWNAKT